MYEDQEIIKFHGCKTWHLPKSPASLISPFCKCYDHDPPPHFSDKLVLITGSDHRTCFLGSPVLQQWLKIPPPPLPVVTSEPYQFGFVNLVDEDDVVFSFKVFCLASLSDVRSVLFLYSSETGTWTSKIIHCTYEQIDYGYISVNTTVYFFSQPGRRLLLAHDLYSDSDQLRVLHYPDDNNINNSDLEPWLTACGPSFMYIKTLSQKEQTLFKIWRLKNDDLGDGSWQLLWDIGIPSIGSHIPIAMNPFDSGVVYLWSLHYHHVISCDLQTRKHRILNEEHQDFFVNRKKIMDEVWGSEYEASGWLFQFVLPRWIQSMPRPPQAEMIDTTSILSYSTSMQEN